MASSSRVKPSPSWGPKDFLTVSIALAVSSPLTPLAPLRPEVEKVVDVEMLENVEAVIIEASLGAGVQRDAGESETESNLVRGFAMSRSSSSEPSTPSSLRVRVGKPLLIL